MAAIYSNRWNILGFNFTKRDALSSVYKISMLSFQKLKNPLLVGESRPVCLRAVKPIFKYFPELSEGCIVYVYVYTNNAGLIY
jgi:hypothetical protein